MLGEAFTKVKLNYGPFYYSRDLIKEVDMAGRELLDAIAILSQRRLPRSLFPDQRLKSILADVDKMVKKNYPDYELAANQRHGVSHILSR